MEARAYCWLSGEFQTASDTEILKKENKPQAYIPLGNSPSPLLLPFQNLYPSMLCYTTVLVFERRMRYVNRLSFGENASLPWERAATWEAELAMPPQVFLLPPEGLPFYSAFF